MSTFRTICLSLAALIALSISLASLFPPTPLPLAQTPAEYGMTSEPAVVDCAKAYGIPQNTTERYARESLVACVAALRRLGH